jgi:hypothetical protein
MLRQAGIPCRYSHNVSEHRANIRDATGFSLVTATADCMPLSLMDWRLLEVIIREVFDLESGFAEQLARFGVSFHRTLSRSSPPDGDS